LLIDRSTAAPEGLSARARNLTRDLEGPLRIQDDEPMALETARMIKGVVRTWRNRLIVRPHQECETAGARSRRETEGFFASYCQGQGLDIGYGGDPITDGVRGWDEEHGDGTLLQGLADASFDYVYSSHCLEHIPDVKLALRNWWRVLKPGGFLLLYLPHRDLYEKKQTLPSRWNCDHKHFFLPEEDEAPDTIGVRPLIDSTLDHHEWVYLKECSAGHTLTDPEVHSDGEYSIEAVIRKLHTE
jgi:SAM-dependent methyltransferase